MTDLQPEPASQPDPEAGPHLSVWPTAQRDARAQRRGRYLPESTAHPAKMLPAIAATAIARYTRPGDLVADPMCGIGTTLVEAVHLGRDGLGIEYEPRWAQVRRRQRQPRPPQRRDRHRRGHLRRRPPAPVPPPAGRGRAGRAGHHLAALRLVRPRPGHRRAAPRCRRRRPQVRQPLRSRPRQPRQPGPGRAPRRVHPDPGRLRGPCCAPAAWPSSPPGPGASTGSWSTCPPPSWPPPPARAWPRPPGASPCSPGCATAGSSPGRRSSSFTTSARPGAVASRGT